MKALSLPLYYPRAFGTWAIFPQLREISLTIDLDASHYLHISLHHVTRFEPIAAAHFDQRYNNIIQKHALSFYVFTSRSNEPIYYFLAVSKLGRKRAIAECDH